ncbi:MAG: hypothetical protein UIB61_03325 [Treponema sp.]|nr:hypothetical protein [Treponema sp.]
MGLNSATIICDSIHELFLPVIKILVNVLSTSVLSWLILKYFLIPLNLEEIYPFAALLIFFIISIFIETLVRIATKKSTSDFSLSFLIILLALNESLNIVDVVLITCCSFISFLILIPLLYSIKKRIDIAGTLQIHGNKKSLVLVSIAIIVTVLAVGNVSWLNQRILP